MCLNPIHVNLTQTKFKYNREVDRSPVKTKKFVPCGKCARCEYNKRSDWAFRLYYENLHQTSGYFCLLTYNEEQAPWLNLDTGEFVRGKDATSKSFFETDRVKRVVYKKDIQDFIKNLRRQQQYWSKKIGFQNEQIRYFIVSEYGTKNTRRPHYHAIIFGMNPYIAEKLTTQKKIWQHGFATAKPLRQDIGAFMYLTKYLYKQKNIGGFPVEPFSLMSRKPYIGHQIEKSLLQHVINQKTLIIDTPFGTKKKIPKVYIDKFPEVMVQAAKRQDLKKTDNLELNMIYELNRKGNKDYGLIKYEKNQYYKKKYDQEIIQLKEVLL